MKRFLRNQDGSASVEFVALAIPLFIPLFIYLNQFANLSGEEEMARTLARASVASSGSDTAEVMMNRVLMAAGQELGLTTSQFSRLAIGLKCSESPCHSPNGRVQVTVHFSATSEFRAVTASAQEYISPWT